MRISWLGGDVVVATRKVLTDSRSWEGLFAPDFQLPCTSPPEVDQELWPQIAEHVARAERVNDVMSREGVERTAARFAMSPHAIEVAMVIAATEVEGKAPLSLVNLLLRCSVDVNLVYGEFLSMLVNREEARTETLSKYQEFCEVVEQHRSMFTAWRERAAAIREGLADLYVSSRRAEDGDRIFRERHREDSNDVAVALSASRAFLAAGEISWAIEWLGRGADRAQNLGRRGMEDKLRGKQGVLQKRLS